MSTGSRPAGLPASLRVGGVDRATLRDRLAAAGVRLNAHAEALFADARFDAAAPPCTVRVEALDVAGLGFAGGATFDALCRAAAARGLGPCPLALGPALRLAWLDQPDEPDGDLVSRGRAPPGSVTLLSPTPADPATTPWGFYLRRVGGEPWLRGYRSDAAHRWAPEDLLLFVRVAAA